MEDSYFKGRGAQINTANPYHKTEIVTEHWEGLDEELMPEAPKTQIFYEKPKNILSKNQSPDIPFTYSINPYQGCEHGCIYCYARNAHQYWGFSAGLDFETKIVVKREAPQLLEKQFLSPHWQAAPIMLSGNTDCYQPIEKDLKITRNLLKVFAKYGNPVSIISKNALILRDLDILQDLAKENLVHVHISITTTDEELRRQLEPRTASAKKRLEVVKKLSQAGVPTGVMIAPIIPALNNYEIPTLAKLAADHGALNIGYTIVRLNGAIGDIFKDWLFKNFPDRAEKVWNQICEMHNGQVNESRYGFRHSGEGKFAQSIAQLFRVSKKKYFADKIVPPYALDKFRRNANLNLF
ncbi:MAG: PA0069 family radical SAM protein [Microscillaceae bacterium]|jgi:DNA repair photolyase|nr:PA0069 family radical SAM protein [Microscillaceae bacterium]